MPTLFLAAHLSLKSRQRNYIHSPYIFPTEEIMHCQDTFVSKKPPRDRLLGHGSVEKISLLTFVFLAQYWLLRRDDGSSATDIIHYLGNTSSGNRVVMKTVKMLCSWCLICNINLIIITKPLLKPKDLFTPRSITVTIKIKSRQRVHPQL